MDELKQQWFNAAKLGHHNKLKNLIKSGIDINLIDPIEGRTALHYSVINNRIKAVELLINQPGIDVNLTEKETLTSALNFAVLNGHFNLIPILIDKGANPNLTDFKDRSALILACELCKKDEKTLDTLIKNTSNINQLDVDGNSALYHAVIHKNRLAIDHLLDANADVHHIDKYGENLLFSAAYPPNIELFNKLYSHGVRLNQLNHKGESLLHIAVKGALNHDNTDVLKFILDKGIDVDISDKNNLYPLYHVFNVTSIMKSRDTVLKLILAKNPSIWHVETSLRHKSQYIKFDKELVNTYIEQKKLESTITIDNTEVESFKF